MNDSCIFDMVNALPDACFKDATSGKYILANDTIAARYGMTSPTQMVGLTIDDLGFVKSELGKRHAAQTRDMDNWVKAKQRNKTITRPVMFFPDSKLTYETVTKVPVLGQHNLLGIITFAHDHTPGLSNHDLYCLYKDLCATQGIAIKKLLLHLEIDTWFAAAPSEAELLVLLERGSGRSNKEIAIERRVSVKTVDTHLNSIRAKLNGDVLPKIIDGLRK
jgi:DNA-directed RNA polymerase specialized sigma24 family protein